VIAVPDDRWQERPLACIVADEDARPAPADLAGFLTGKVASWWVPERWAVVEEIPKTSVGKIDKKRLRARHAAGEIDVVVTSKESRGAPAVMTEQTADVPVDSL
jgi:fatty-acyl-CoA synthase